MVKLRTWIIVFVVVALAASISSLFILAFKWTETGFIGTLDWQNSPMALANQAEREFAFERCAKDPHNLDSLTCNTIKSGEVPIPPKYLLTPNLSDEEVLIEVRKLPEVQAFKTKYTPPYEVIWREETSGYVKYVVERLRSGEQDSPIRESEALHLQVKFDSIGQISLEYQGGGEVITENVLDSIKTTECPI